MSNLSNLLRDDALYQPFHSLSSREIVNASNAVSECMRMFDQVNIDLMGQFNDTFNADAFCHKIDQLIESHDALMDGMAEHFGRDVHVGEDQCFARKICDIIEQNISSKHILDKIKEYHPEAHNRMSDKHSAAVQVGHLQVD